jgi:hypothetical protein
MFIQQQDNSLIVVDKKTNSLINVLGICDVLITINEQKNNSKISYFKEQNEQFIY